MCDVRVGDVRQSLHVIRLSPTVMGLSRMSLSARRRVRHLKMEFKVISTTDVIKIEMMEFSQAEEESDI